MIYSIFPQKDTTIYNDYKKMNTGLDQVLEIRKSFYKINEGTIAETHTTQSSISRILIKFDLTEISSSVSAGSISNAKYYLKLNPCDAQRLALDYTVEAYAISQSWDMGNGFKASSPMVTENGASWLFRMTGSLWTGSLTNSTGGATFYSDVSSSQTFSYESNGILMDVTSIVNAWMNGTKPNEGFILKYSNAIENDIKEYGAMTFFSRDTNTIYPPTLQVRWDDSTFSTASLTELSSTDLDDVVFSVKGLKERYTKGEKPKIRLMARDRYPAKMYVTSSRYSLNKYLPSSSYYAIKDAHTEEIIIPFDTGSTKISCDSNGNYLNLWTSGMQPERYYRLMFKIVDNTREQIFDNNYIFKIVR